MAAGGTGVGIKSKAENGPVVLNISKELTREIFEEFPVVQDAYARFVPGVSLSSRTSSSTVAWKRKLMGR
jgi:transcription initiation factor TFIIH subunit 1